jgi:proline dehydrogenase
MGLARNAVLWAADNRWLREHLPRYRFVRASVRRFMPGETTDEAITAARRLGQQGLPTMFTLLGENVTNLDAARRVVDDYRATYGRIVEESLDTEISVKPSHLGVDLEPDAAMANLEELATTATELGNWLWLDMEGAPYVDPTLDLYRKLRARHPNVGIALQAYLKRTADDIDSLMPLDPTIRLVKGAYREPREIVFGSREVIEEAYRRRCSSSHARARWAGLRWARTTWSSSGRSGPMPTGARASRSTCCTGSVRPTRCGWPPTGTWCEP